MLKGQWKRADSQLGSLWQFQTIGGFLILTKLALTFRRELEINVQMISNF